MTYLRGNARISTLLTVALTGAVLLGACAPAANNTANPQRRLKRTTTTSYEWEDTTTTYTVPPTTSRNPADVAYEYLMNEVPEWSDIPRYKVEELLQTVCDGLDESDGDFLATGESLVIASQDTFDLTYSQAGTVMGAAVIIRCPEWSDAATEYANS